MGSTFDLYLPALDDKTLDAPKTGPSLSRCGGTETILLVEDSDAVRVLAENILRRLGYTLITARDGQDAMTLSGKHAGSIDLVLTDVVMPGVGGRALAERLRHIDPTLKVIFLSGYTDEAMLRHGTLPLGTQFLQKPFSLQALANAVRRVLDERIETSHVA